MAMGRPSWEPMTSETAEAFLAKLKLAHDELSEPQQAGHTAAGLTPDRSFDGLIDWIVE